MTRPVYSVVAGPNGSGKSTLIRRIEASGSPLKNYHNADDIARRLGGTRVSANRQAQGMVRHERQRALRERRDFSYETVMSHPSHVEAMEDARQRGFVVRLYFVAVESVDVNLGRVATRVGLGGHYVPPDKIAERRDRVLNNCLFRAVCAAHQSFVFDNTNGESGGPLSVAHIQQWQATLFRHAHLTWPDACLFQKLEDDPRFTVVNET